MKRRGIGRTLRLALLCCLALVLPYVAAQSQQAGESVEELVGRLLLLAFPASDPPLERLEELQPAGFLFYPSNVPSTAAVRNSTRALQSAASYPLLFGIDQEGGPFSSYRTDEATIFPGNMALAASGDPELAAAVAEASGRELSYAGFNMNFAPVVDVNSNPDNPIIGIRSFGSDAAVVGEFGRAFHRGLERSGVAAVAKHFPGHGDTVTDSHLALPSVEKERSQFNEVELPPFVAMIDAEVPAIMTAHVVFPAFDAGVPGTLSAAVLTGLLRQELGYGGLIITDYMDMKAIVDNFGPGEAAVRSVVAGADLVLLGPDLETQREVRSALLQALENGELSEARVREAVARSEAVARRYRPMWDSAPPDYRAHQRLAIEVAMRGATLLRNEGVLPLESNSRVVAIAPTPSLFGAPPHLGDVLARYRQGVTSVQVGESPSDAEMARAVAAAEEADVVVLGTYHWLGEFPESMNELAQRLAATGKPLIVVAVGNPDDVRFLTVEPQAYLAVYGYREANLAGASAILTGEALPGGKLPVPAGDRPVGSGMDGF